MNALVSTHRLRLELPDASNKTVLGRPLPKLILNNVSISINRGQTVGIVGESGSGKTSLGRCLVRLNEATRGRIEFNGADITRVSKRVMGSLRQRMQMIFQDPQSSLNPRRKIGEILAQPMQFFEMVQSRDEAIRAVSFLLRDVGLPPEFAERYPHELSGGQRQRVGIARAISVRPDFIVADEIVSGLDVSTQAQILELLAHLKEARGLSLAFISHDLSVVRAICDHVYVLQNGNVIESGPCETLFEQPKTAYTRELIDAIPLPVPDKFWLDDDKSDSQSSKPDITTQSNSSSPMEKTMKISGAIALVTGANRGVGKCFIDELARRGAAKVYVTARRLENLDFPSMIGSTRIVPLMLDITNTSHIEASVKAADDVNLLINNAGINRGGTLIGAQSIDDAKDEMETNYFGTIAMCRAFAPVIEKAGGGTITNMLSILGQVNLPLMGSLSASKAAAYNATQGIRAELACKGINVVSVLPGAIDTDMSKDFPPPKMSPLDVVADVLDGVEAGEVEIYPGDMAKELRDGLKSDPMAVQQQMAAVLEQMTSHGAGAGEYVTVTAADGGTFKAYVARPEKGSGPGLVMLQEIFGINDYMRAMADRYAEEGYVAIVPDLFWRLEADVDLGYGEDDFQKAFSLYQKFDTDKAMMDIQDTITHLRGMEGVSGKVGTLGYCLGGLLAFLSSTRTDADVAVGYYAVGIEGYLDEAEKVSCPLVLHFAGNDSYCPAELREKITGALQDKTDVQLYTYDGMDHAFATPGRDHYDKPSTMMAYSRSLTALRRVLGPVYDLENLWDMHCYYEFATRDVTATMETMVAEPYVNHIPTMTGGVGHDHLKRFYTHHFVNANPEDTKLIPISRTIGSDRLVDEMLFCFTHTTEIDWMLPGIEPTGKYVEVPLVAIVNFRGDKLYHEHIYWDQASVLVQIGKLDPEGLPVAGHATAKKLLDETLPSNELMAKAWATSEGKPV